MSQANVSRLVEDLGNLPGIVGGLGLSIAEAQKQLNADFVLNVGRLLEIIRNTLGTGSTAPDNDTREAIAKLLTALAPSRYQFTETTIEFSADIAERMQKQTEVGVSLGKAVMLNAAFSKAFGYDYRAAARITSVLHAVPVGQQMVAELLARAPAMEAPQLPDRTKLDSALFDGVTGVYQSILGKDATAKLTGSTGAGGAS